MRENIGYTLIFIIYHEEFPKKKPKESIKIDIMIY